MAVTAKQKPKRSSGFFDTKRGRTIVENLTAYAFLTPAMLVLFIFGIFPVAFAFFVSLHRWRRFPGDFRGLDNYVDALGNFAFVAFFWLALGAILYGAYTLYRFYKEERQDEQPRAYAYIIPGGALAIAIALFTRWLFTAIPFIFNVPERVRGQELSRTLFVSEFFNSFTFPEVTAAATVMLIGMVITIPIVLLSINTIKIKRTQHYLSLAMLAGLAFIGGAVLMQLTVSEIDIAIAEALEAGTSVPIWSQIIIISAGAGLMGVALWLWNNTVHDQNARFYVLRVLAVVAAVIGGVLLIQELPSAFADHDDDIARGFGVTVWYALFSVPMQISLGLILAVLLFQNIRGKSFFRLVYFLPYITPFVATSVVFSLLFSPNEASLANQFIGVFGIEKQDWLFEEQGIFQLMLGEFVPDAFAGPSLALMEIILYNIWIYAGFSSVIFLAGLGGIPEDVYEAARIDGATWWHQFRFITIPVLSPSTFFLILVATIGTFLEFTQIF
ncbi:MAG: ABC transporter permease subunit, partial [Chloroflexota bacterium]